MAKAQKKYVLVVVEYFIKWMDAEAMGAITENRIEDFVWKDIICRFRILTNLITDNGPQFQKKFNRYCSNLHINHHPTFV